jgi:hypothetical protein
VQFGLGTAGVAAACENSFGIATTIPAPIRMSKTGTLIPMIIKGDKPRLRLGVYMDVFDALGAFLGFVSISFLNLFQFLTRKSLTCHTTYRNCIANNNGESPVKNTSLRVNCSVIPPSIKVMRSKLFVRSY